MCKVFSLETRLDRINPIQVTYAGHLDCNMTSLRSWKATRSRVTSHLQAQNWATRAATAYTTLTLRLGDNRLQLEYRVLPEDVCKIDKFLYTK